MDPKLAEIYGTADLDESDVEKLAAAELADGLTEDDSLDVDDIDEDTLEALAQEVLEASDEGDDGDEGDEGDEYDGDEDDGTEKVAEADYLGRVMAHAYVQELRGIEKEAADAAQRRGLVPYKKGGDPAIKKSLKAANKLGISVADTKKHYEAAKAARLKARAEKRQGHLDLKNKHRKTTPKGSFGHMDNVASHGRVMGGARNAAGRVGSFVSKHKVPAGLAAAGLLAGGGVMAGRAMRKESSALDTLAEQRALEILEANGFDLGAEKIAGADAYDVLGDAVEQRALQMLIDAGYDVE